MPTVTNYASGAIGTVIQVGDVCGDVTIGADTTISVQPRDPDSHPAARGPEDPVGSR